MPAAISIRVKAPKQDYCFLIRPFDTQFDTVETAVTEAAKRCSLLVATSRNIQDYLKWIENVEYGILAARLVVAICSPQDLQQTPSARVTFNNINGNVLYELGRAHAVGKPTLILAANRAALPLDITWTNILEYDAKDVLVIVDKLSGALQHLQDNSENGLVDKRAHDVKSLCGVPAALATPDFLAYLSDMVCISREYCENMYFLQSYIKGYRDSYRNAQKTTDQTFSVQYFNSQYIDSTPPGRRF